MFGEIILAGVALVTPINDSIVEYQQYKMQSSALYSSADYIKKLDNELFFLDNGNNYVLMEPNSSIQKKAKDNTYKFLTIFKSKLKDLIIDFEEEHNYFSFISELRKGENYEEFLRYALRDGSVNVCNAISIFLSQKNYELVSTSEENFIIALLKTNNIQLQEFALDALLNWDKISNVEELKTVKIDNSYLQEDLDDFIESKR